eukprot:TRINITY_DN117411_c0_g1_i1.p1 TRINITY_DN117411_c0_g1~~TRINITY_DN117411_c0_g1_i1.p1  ORF type:complete len:148 (-),score=11.49 TRINITY_DN117411_c0_g1_i1:10-453(-)
MLLICFFLFSYIGSVIIKTNVMSHLKPTYHGDIQALGNRGGSSATGIGGSGRIALFIDDFPDAHVLGMMHAGNYRGPHSNTNCFGGAGTIYIKSNPDNDGNYSYKQLRFQNDVVSGTTDGYSIMPDDVGKLNKICKQLSFQHFMDSS